MEQLLDLGPRTWLLFASSGPLEAPEVGLLRHRAAAVWLDLLDERAAEKLIARGDGWLTAADAAAMRDEAGRHPFFLQLLGRRLLAARRAEAKSTDVFGEVLQAFRAEAAARLRAIWHELDAWERDALHDAGAGTPVRRTPRLAALLTEGGAPFGRVLADWLEREKP